MFPYLSSLHYPAIYTYTLIIEGIHHGNESTNLIFLSQAHYWNVREENSVKVFCNFRVVCRAQKLQ
jgi:hypothetical protein